MVGAAVAVAGRVVVGAAVVAGTVVVGAASVVGTASYCEPAPEHEDATSSHASNVPVHALRPIRRS